MRGQNWKPKYDTVFGIFCVIFLHGDSKVQTPKTHIQSDPKNRVTVGRLNCQEFEWLKVN